MSIAAWNVNHQARQRTFPEAVRKGILSLSPHIVVLTEYVEGDDHPRFCDELMAEGFGKPMMTEAGNHNQVLIASRFPASKVKEEDGAILPPPRLGRAHSNWLHIRLAWPPLDIVGMRVPDPDSKGDPKTTRGGYWNWFETAVDPLFHRASVIIGDFNCDPNSKKTGFRQLRKLRDRGWRWQDPVGEVSCRAIRGPSRIDHALVSPAVEFNSAQYIHSVEGFDFIGRRPLSDHAPLLIVLTLSTDSSV